MGQRLAHGKTVCDYGEFTTDTTYWKNSGGRPSRLFPDSYREFISGTNDIPIACEPDIESLRPYS